MAEFKGSVTFGGQIECLTGLHIGGAREGYEIGGAENTVIRNPVDQYPYIPGSSLKGKMRSLLEWATPGKLLVQNGTGEVHWCPEPDCAICRIFGVPAEHASERRTGPSRLIVRDAFPDDPTWKEMEKLEEEQGLPKVEVKTEVVIDRIAGAAMKRIGPRSQERVHVRARFQFELLYSIFDVRDVVNTSRSDVELLPDLFTALMLVEMSALGGGGSRGSGQVRFWLYGEPLIMSTADYRQGGNGSQKLAFSYQTDEEWKRLKEEGYLLTLADFQEQKLPSLLEQINQKLGLGGQSA